MGAGVGKGVFAEGGLKDKSDKEESEGEHINNNSNHYLLLSKYILNILHLFIHLTLRSHHEVSTAVL